jgi:hypothetical protein
MKKSKLKSKKKKNPPKKSKLKKLKLKRLDIDLLFSKLKNQGPKDSAMLKKITKVYACYTPIGCTGTVTNFCYTI